MATTPSTFRSCGGHGLAGIVGYEVRETILPDGTVTGLAGRIVATFGRANQYGQAMDVAHELRRAGGYAVVDNLYGCGHTDRDSFERLR